MTDISADELRRREAIVINDFGGVQPMFEAFYDEAIHYAAKRAVQAFGRYDDAIEVQDRDGVVAHAQEALTHAASVSRFFWPPGKKNSLPVCRAAKLRTAFKLDDNSPLANRALRNALEHFDERLDEYLLRNDAGFFFPGPMVDNSELADEAIGHIFRLVDPRKNIFVLCGVKFEFGPIRQAISSLFEDTGKPQAGQDQGDSAGSSEAIAPHLRSDFRTMAKAALARAKVELATNDNERLRYACVDLRLALEALTYDRASVYRDELPPEHLSMWQPGRLLKVLLEIDPGADQTRTIRMGEQPASGVLPATMKVMGTDVALSLKTIKSHYDALSSFIHMPTLKKVEEGWKPDPVSVRNHCEVTAEAIQKVVESRLFRSNFSKTSEIDCFRCRKPIKRRISQKVGEGLTRCFECGASHRYSMEPDGKVLWQPVTTDIVCQTASCGEAFTLFDDEVKPGTEWHCPGCKTHYGISLSVYKKGEPAAENPA